MLAQFSAKETGQEQLSIPVNVKGGSNASVFHRAIGHKPQGVARVWDCDGLVVSEGTLSTLKG